jgi:hypothetical protein
MYSHYLYWPVGVLFHTGQKYLWETNKNSVGFVTKPMLDHPADHPIESRPDSAIG